MIDFIPNGENTFLAICKASLKPFGEIKVIETNTTLDPHAEWYENASAKMIYKASVEFINLLRKVKHVLIVANEKYKSFFDRLVNKGLLRAVGHLEDINGANVFFYQAKRV